MGSLGQVHVDCLAVALVNVDTVKDGKSRMWQERVSPRGEGEKMKALLTAKVGMFLVVSSVLAVWTLLAAQHVQAHSLTDPVCSGLPTAADFFTETAALDLDPNTAPTTTATATPKKGTGETGEGKTAHHYAKITVPALTAGELTVSDGADPSTTGPSEGILCGPDVKSLPSYSEDHAKAEKAATTARKDAMDADKAAADAAADTADNEASLKRTPLPAVAKDLESAAKALEAAAAALRKIDTIAANAAATRIATYTEGDLTSGEAKEAADAAAAAAAAAKDADDSADEAFLRGALEAAAGRLKTAAGHLETAAIALDPHMGFNINTLISSGDEEYVVVVTVPEGTDPLPTLNVSFKGVMTNGTNITTDGSSFTSPNQRIIHTLTATDPGLLTVRTTGSAVNTKGTLNKDGDEIAMDEGSGGNFEIVSPMDDDVAYSVFVDGQTRNEMGDYGLKVEFKVAKEDLGVPATSDDGITRGDEEITHGADYFFFTSGQTGYRFLTVQTEKHDDVTTATNTTGTLFSTKGVVNTDTDSGFGTNFLIRAPISPGDYIVEVKGLTGRKYALKFGLRRGDPPDDSYRR